MPVLTTHIFAIGGDPTFYGWLVCFAYLVTGWFCLQKSKQLVSNHKSVIFWVGLALFMFALGVNKQLDLQTLLVNMVKVVLKEYGWYVYKKQIQHALVVALAMILILFLLVTFIIFAEAWHRFKLAWLGIFFLFCFIFLRFAYFDREAKALLDFLGRYYKLLELLGIVLILFASKQKKPSAS